MSRSHKKSKPRQLRAKNQNIEIMRDAEVHKVTSLSRTTRWRHERRGEFPKRVQISAGLTGYIASEIADWLAARQHGQGRTPTAALEARASKRTKNGGAA